MEIGESGNDLEDTKAAFGEDEKSRLELEKGCSLKTQEWEEIKKTIAEELVALADAFQVLNERSPKQTKKRSRQERGLHKRKQIVKERPSKCITRAISKLRHIRTWTCLT